MSQHDPFQDRGRALEDAFFSRLDQQLLEKLRAKIAATETVQALADLSGISEPTVLNDLVGHGITAANFAALALLPSVEVAWSDGAVSPQEQEAVLKAAVAQGLNPDGPGLEILKVWLRERPSGDMLKAWGDYAAALVKALPADQLARIRTEIIAKAKAVAAASGGFLGLGSKISAAEEKTLERFAGALLP